MSRTRTKRGKLRRDIQHKLTEQEASAIVFLFEEKGYDTLALSTEKNIIVRHSTAWEII